MPVARAALRGLHAATARADGPSTGWGCRPGPRAASTPIFQPLPSRHSVLLPLRDLLRLQHVRRKRGSQPDDAGAGPSSSIWASAGMRLRGIGTRQPQRSRPRRPRCRMCKWLTDAGSSTELVAVGSPGSRGSASHGFTPPGATEARNPDRQQRAGEQQLGAEGGVESVRLPVARGWRLWVDLVAECDGHCG